MANQKVYTIQINGLTESISAVESLNKQLDNLDKRINALQSQNIKLNTSSGGKAALSEEEAVQREINKLKQEGATLDAKIAATQDEVYKKVDATKQLYKETVADQKAIAAEERLIANAYSNTMQGMKSHLADLKAAINTTDLGDTEKISQMTKEAGELSNKLKEMEQAYGQFGRNVGNYAEGVAEGLSKVKINVGGTVREFDNAKQASKELGNELKTMAVNGQQGTKEFKDLQKAVAALNSDIKDATVSSKAMDNLLDTMQSFAAIGSVTKGFSALFGFDDSEIEKSIQKLVALQNVMEGIEKINQQMNTGEGIGGWLSKGNAAVDTLVEKLTGANKAQVALNASTTAGKTASEGLAVAETAQAAATTTATVATKALSLALKTIGIGLIISAVAYLITYWKEIYKWFTDTIPALKNLSTWFDKIRAVAMGVGSAVLNYMVQPLATLVKVIQAVINKNWDEIPNIIGNGVKKTFNVVGNFQKGYYKETERQQEAHNKKVRENQKKANEEFLKDEEAKYGQSHKRTQEYLKKQMDLVDQQIAKTKKGSGDYNTLIAERKEYQRKLWEDERKQREEANKKSVSDSKKYAKEEAEGEKYKYELKLKLMQEGFEKILLQIDQEEKEEIKKAKKYGADITQVQEFYDKKRLEAKRNWANDVKNTYVQLYNDLRQLISENENQILENTKSNIRNTVTSQTNAALKELVYSGSRNYTNYGSVKDITKRQPSTFDYNSVYTEDEIKKAKQYLDVQQKLIQAQIEHENLMKQLPKEQEKWNEAQLNAYNISKIRLRQLDEEAGKLKEQIDINLALSLWDDAYSKNLTEAFLTRIREREKYYNKVNDINKKAYKEEEDAQLKHLEELRKKEKENAGQRYVSKNSQTISDRVVQLGDWREQNNLYDTDAWKNAMDELYKQITDAKGKYFGENGELAQALRDGKLEMDKFFMLSLAEAKEYKEKMKAIDEKYDQERITLQNQTNQNIQNLNETYYSNMISEFSDFSQELNNRYGRQPILNNFKIVDVAKTKKNLKEVKDGYIQLITEIIQAKAKLQNALDKNEISFDDFKVASSQLNDLENKVNEAINGTTEKMKYLPGEFIASINTYIQAGLQGVQTIMQAFNEYQDYEFDKEQDALDKENEMLEDKLGKQKEIVEKHKSEVESIEDELATSRGDRRQHLIDQLNAEMEAQRRAYEEQKKIEHEKQVNEKKQEELDKKRKQAEYDRNLNQILISTAMATANGLATQPFVPVGIAMGALATTLGMVQYALAKKQKPYATGGQLDGGVAVGNRHRDGGIKVLGGRAEIEGGEYVTNRLTTAKNLDLLEYVNSKKKRIDISDMLEFYNNGKVKTSIQKVRTKFEDGGYIAPLPDTIDIKEQLQNIVVNQDNRPIYVSVVDINNKQADVRRVQTLAGLSE